MKRKEMLGKISDVLLQFMPNTQQNIRNLIADVVLTECEREGMLPPDYKGDIFGWNEGFISQPEWQEDEA